QNLFDFVPELGNPEQGLPVAAGKLLLDLTVAYGREWILARWERGELGPLFDREDKADVPALSAQLAEQAAWAQRATEDVGQRDAVIRDLQAQLAQQTDWAQRATEDVGQRDAVIRDLQAQLAQQTDWAQRA